MPIYFRNTPVKQPFLFDSIGYDWYQEPMNRPKGYPHFHYLQTEQGMGQIHIQGKHYTLNPGEGLFIAPFVGHSYQSISKEEWHTCFFTLTGTLESSIGRLFDNQQIICVEKELGTLLRKEIVRIAGKFETLPVDAKSLSVDCYSLLMHFVDGGYTKDLEKEVLYKRYVEPVLKRIETDYASELTIQELSQQVYVTPQYLSRLFRRFLDCSAYEYLTACRINKAKELLLTDNSLEIQEIAIRTGFSDASHFIAMFKKAAGFTPREFRKING